MTSFVLKMIAALTMTVDHVGLIIFPDLTILRIIGRIAFPIYAFCIAEGYRYTRSRIKYFFRLFLLGAACQFVYVVFLQDTYIGVLLTFSMSILLISCLDAFKKSLFDADSFMSDIGGGGKRGKITRCILSALLFVLLTSVFWKLSDTLQIDYGFFGIMLPVFVYMFDKRIPKILMFALGTFLVAFSFRDSFPIQYWSLLTVPLIALYNGKRGKYKMKYFFYIFYPAHLVIIYLISLLVR